MKHKPYWTQEPGIMTADVVWCQGHQQYEYFDEND